MTREEIAQIHKALQESNECAEKCRELALSKNYKVTARWTLGITEQNKAAMEILSKEYKLTDLPYHGHKGNFNEDKS